jgi:hypothetical protein
VADVSLFVVGITAPKRKRQTEMSHDEWQQVQELRRLESQQPGQLPVP